MSSRYRTSTNNIRTMSIYSTRKEFETPTEELNFAKEYNKKINTLSQNRNRSSLEHNDALNYSRNPLLDSVEKDFRSSCRKTKFSDISHINFENPSGKNEEQWKPSSKKVEPKESKTSYELQRRQLKSSTEVKILNRNPLVEGDIKQPFKIRQEKPISEEYASFKNKQAFLPSELRSPVNYNPIKQKQMGNEFRNVFQFNDGTSENVARKVNEFSIAERKFVEANKSLKHHKKGDALLEAQEKFRQILRK